MPFHIIHANAFCQNYHNIVIINIRYNKQETVNLLGLIVSNPMNCLEKKCKNEMKSNIKLSMLLMLLIFDSLVFVIVTKQLELKCLVARCCKSFDHS